MTPAPQIDGRPLRIAYFTEWSPHRDGVLRKMIGQAETWRELGCEARIFSLSTTRDTPPVLDFERHGQIVGAIPQRALERWPFARLGYFNKIASVPQVLRKLREFAPDILYYRQNGPWYPGLGSILRAAPSVVEINTDEAAELKLWGRLFGAFYAFSQGRIHKGVTGFVTVTDEIARPYRKLGKPIAVVPNGFWIDPPAEVAPSGTTRPTLVFTGSQFNLDMADNWHGVDKLLVMAAALPEADFEVAGMDASDFAGLEVPPNVRFHGFLGAAALTALYRRSDVGISTLAAHRHNLEEGCSLKVRDYLAHRLPLILAYREAQPELNAAPYVLSIGNTPDNVERNIGRIRDFVRDWHGRRVTADLTFLSRYTKERERLDFLAKVATGTA